MSHDPSVWPGELKHVITDKTQVNMQVNMCKKWLQCVTQLKHSFPK